MPTPADFPPPPTFTLPVIVDETTEEDKFNPIWLEWFLRLAAVISAAGGGGGGIFHNLLAGLQGGAADEFFHLDQALYDDLVAGGAFQTIQVPGESDVVAAGYQDILNLESASAEIAITTDAGTKTITLTFTGTPPAPPSPTDAHWEPISNMNPASPALVFDGATGDVVMGWIS